MRQAYSEKEDTKKLKAKQREKMAPKMGRMDIDYQVLHDAFFKYQTRPKLTALGEVYYEGKVRGGVGRCQQPAWRACRQVAAGALARSHNKA
jgi:hypothetical protein